MDALGKYTMNLIHADEVESVVVLRQGQGSAPLERLGADETGVHVEHLHYGAQGPLPRPLATCACISCNQLDHCSFSMQHRCLYHARCC